MRIQNNPFICGQLVFNKGTAIDWICVLYLQFICWNIIPNIMVIGGGVFGRWLGHKGGTLINGISAIIKEAPESSLTPSATWGHREKLAVYKPGNETSQDTESAGAFMLNFPGSRTVRDKCLLFKPTSLW